MSDFEKIKNGIISFEQGKSTLDNIVNLIEELTGKLISEYEIRNYNNSESLDDFVKRITAKQILDWESIDDNRALELIYQILGNVNDDAIISINTEALEKRYAKASGTISDWIFQEDIAEAKEILKLLKKNTALLL